MIDLKKLRSQMEDGVSGKGIANAASCSEVLELLDMLEAAQKKSAQDRIDAECFRWWVHEAAANPVLVAKAIAHCITEDEYREVICGAMKKRDEAISAAMESKQ